MNIVPLEFSIVVVGEDCNPTILNPDFLKYQGIVPDEWGWKVKGVPIMTPPFSVVPYDSGVTVKVETNRFQVTDQEFAGEVSKTKATDIAHRYISVLPHVKYTSVGINFRILLEMEEPDSFLVKRFLKVGPWNVAENPLKAMSLKLVYLLDEEGRLNLSLDAGAVVRQQKNYKEQKKGVLAGANYHRDCPDYPADKSVLQYVNQAENDAEHLTAAIHKFLLND